MIKYLLLFIFFTGFSDLSRGQTTITIMTYNIRLDAASDGPNNWHHRKDDMIHFFHSENVDFIGVQEALSHQVNYLDQGLADYDYIGVGRDDGNEAGEYMAIFYKPEKWKMVQDSTVWLSENPDKPSRGWDAACNRVITIGIFQNGQGDTIQIYNTHLDHIGVEARKGSVDLISELFHFRTKRWPFYLIGDFNFTPDHMLYNRLSGLLTDATVSDQPEGTFNGFSLDGSFDRRIDFIFYDNPSSISISSEVLYPKTKTGLQLSDHFPVKASFELINFSSNRK